MPSFIKFPSPAKTASALLGLAASLALCVAAAPANAAGDARVRIDDLDLSRPEDQATLRLRAKRAARQVCGVASRSPLTSTIRCRDAVLAEIGDAARVVQSERDAAAFETPRHLSALCWHK